MGSCTDGWPCCSSKRCWCKNTSTASERSRRNGKSKHRISKKVFFFACCDITVTFICRYEATELDKKKKREKSSIRRRVPSPLVAYRSAAAVESFTVPELKVFCYVFPITYSFRLSKNLKCRKCIYVQSPAGQRNTKIHWPIYRMLHLLHSRLYVINTTNFSWNVVMIGTLNQRLLNIFHNLLLIHLTANKYICTICLDLHYIPYCCYKCGQYNEKVKGEYFLQKDILPFSAVSCIGKFLCHSSRTTVLIDDLFNGDIKKSKYS